MQRVGRLQVKVLSALRESKGLTCGDLARSLGVHPKSVYQALRGLRVKGLVASFPFHMSYYGGKGVYMQPIRVYVLTVRGAEFLEGLGHVERVNVKSSPSEFSFRQFQVWGRGGALNRKVLKEAWAGFKSQREKLKAKLQA